MNPETKHDERVDRYAGSLGELAEDIGRLRYDALAKFLKLFSLEMQRQADADGERGRFKLAAKLDAVSDALKNAHLSADHAWNICESFMREQNDKETKSPT